MKNDTFCVVWTMLALFGILFCLQHGLFSWLNASFGGRHAPFISIKSEGFEVTTTEKSLKFFLVMRQSIICPGWTRSSGFVTSESKRKMTRLKTGDGMISKKLLTRIQQIIKYTLSVLLFCS
jgi:hypothetical protein